MDHNDAARCDGGAPACPGDRLMPICRRFPRSVVLPAERRALATARSGTRSRSIVPGARFSIANGPATPRDGPARSSGFRSACARSCIDGVSANQTAGSNASTSTTSRPRKTGSNERTVALARARVALSSACSPSSSSCSEPPAATFAAIARLFQVVASSTLASMGNGECAPRRARLSASTHRHTGHPGCAQASTSRK